MRNILSFVTLLVGPPLVSLAVLVAALLVLAWPFKWVWNAAVPPAFTTPEIGYWTAFWLMLLLAWLFKAGKKA